MDKQSFLPFYERIIAQFSEKLLGKVIISIFLGLAFLIPHYLSIGNKVFSIKDWSWFLSALITTTMLCLYYGTHSLRTLLPEIDMRLRPSGNQVLITTLNRILSDRHFTLAGLFFGLLNCGLGWIFGLPYSEEHAVITILIGYFLTGFVCGMAVFGVYGVCVTIRIFFQETSCHFDFRSPDHCGGTLFLGQMLVELSLIVLLVGIMISVYILNADWTRDNTGWIMALKYLWIVFPYMMSLFALIAPVVPINSELRHYKVKQDLIIQTRLSEICKQLDDNEIDATKRKELREDYQFQQNVREDLHSMRTWPYDVSANLKYLTGIVPSLFASVSSASQWIDKLHKFTGLQTWHH